MALFAAGETGRHGRPSDETPRWAWRASAIGWLLAAAHFVLAFDLRHGWSQASAIAETARQTAAVYGVEWGGGVYVNYAFLGVWALDLWTWRPARRRPIPSAGVGTWIVRAFFLVVWLNAAVIFAAGMRRALGVLLVTWLILAWRPRVSRRLPAL